MVPKGNLHGAGGVLAAYMVTGKEGERAELAELRGFRTGHDIIGAFMDVQRQARTGTHCAKPFFHAYVRLAPGEELFREQWLYTADRLEEKFGFSGQPRAIAFHHSIEGETHMHIAWSRIDTEKMCAIDPGLFKNKCKEVARELEIEFDLRRLDNQRAPDLKTRAPTRDEFEEARRLGIDLSQVRETIRHCWDHSKNGQSFAMALKQEKLILARGDKRDFVVIDHESGHHALSKRILGVTAKAVREKLSDLDREHLPSVGQARTQQLDRRMVVKDHPELAAQSNNKEPSYLCEGQPVATGLYQNEARLCFSNERKIEEFVATINLSTHADVMSRKEAREEAEVQKEAGQKNNKAGEAAARPAEQQRAAQQAKGEREFYAERRRADGSRRAPTVKAGHVSGTRPPQITPQPRRFLPGAIKQLFKEMKQALRPPAAAPQSRRKSRRRGGETRGGFRLAAADQLGRIARSIMHLRNFTFHPPAALDEGRQIHLWHQNNQDSAGHETAEYHNQQNYLSLHL